MDADGELEIVVAYGVNIAIFKPSTGPSVVRGHGGQHFSLLDRGPGNVAILATLNNVDVAMYEGLSAAPEKTFTLPLGGLNIAMMSQAPGGEPVFAISDYAILTLRSYETGEVIASESGSTARSLTAVDLDGDNRTEIIGWDQDFNIWRVGNDYIFRDTFE